MNIPIQSSYYLKITIGIIPIDFVLCQYKNMIRTANKFEFIWGARPCIILIHGGEAGIRTRGRDFVSTTV